MLEGIRQRLRALFRKDEFEAELEEEFRFHLEQLVERNLREGMGERQARAEAFKEFSGAAQSMEECRDARGVRWIEEMGQDLRYGLRLLRRSPVFCLTSILTLAIGIGANTAVFTLVEGLFLRALPAAEPGRLAKINLLFSIPGRETREQGVPWPMYLEYRRTQQSMVDLTAFEFGSVSIRDSEGVFRSHTVQFLTGDGFRMLGVEPALGRFFSATEDIPGGPPEGWPVVLSYSFWKLHFNSDPAVIGRRIELSPTVATVIGVAPPRFEGVQPGVSARIFVPFQILEILEKSYELNSPKSPLFCRPIGRLKPGVELAQANLELAARQQEYSKKYLSGLNIPAAMLEHINFRVSSARTGMGLFKAGPYARPLLLMQGLVAVVLLLCCVNVSGLSMARAASRQCEFALRVSLGAGRSRLIRQYLTESFALSMAGAALGGAAAWYGVRFLLKYFIGTNDQVGLQIEPDFTVLLTASLCALAATLLFGAIPAWRASRTDPGALVKSGNAPGRRRRIAGSALIPLQIAISLVLVAAAGLLSQSLYRMRSEKVGYDIGHITITCAQFHILPQKGDALLDLYQRMVDRLEQSTGIEAAAVTWFTPMTNSMAVAGFQSVPTSGLSIQESRQESRMDPQMAWNTVGPGYFRTMQTRILMGREFNRDERSNDVCILNQSAASFLFPGASALGQYVRTNQARVFPAPLTCRVVGIAEDAKYESARQAPPRTLYFPLNQENLRGNLVFLIRSQDEGKAAAAYQKALVEVAPTTPLLRFTTLQRQMDDSMGAQRLITLMCNLFSALALFLSAIGIYGVLTSSVAARTREIGVRIALGAMRSTVLGMILLDSLRLLLAGVLIAVPCFVLSIRLIQEMLYCVTKFHPITLIGAGLLTVIVILLAALAPALRAASIDPMRALRAE